MQLTDSFVVLLDAFRTAFTTPSFQTFTTLLTGWCLSHRMRFVTECIQTAGATHHRHFSCYHRFFSRAAWSLDQLSHILALLIISTFAASGTIHLALDDTLCRKRGLSLFGAGMHYDPLRSSKARKATSWGHDWVVLCIIVQGLPWCPSKVWSLPVAFRFYRNQQGNRKGNKGKKLPPDPAHRTRPELAVELLTMIAGWLPEQTFCVTADSLYGGKSVAKHLSANMHLISKANAQAALFAPAPPRVPGQKGRSRKKGDRLSTMQVWAADEQAPWEELSFDQFGLHAQLSVKVRQCLYYYVTGTRLLTVILTRDMVGGRPDTLFYCTDVSLCAREVLSRYACRWSIEVTFRDSKQTLGLEDPANRKEKAVKRTAPMSLLLYSLLVVWAEKGGHGLIRFPYRPWYRQKQEASFADVLTALRRKSWEEFLGGAAPDHPVTQSRWDQMLDFVSRTG